MKFKVGDKVRVKNIEELKKINEDTVDREFFYWADKIVTIEEIFYDGHYHIKETNRFWFSDDDFLPIDFTLEDLEFGDMVIFSNGSKLINTKYYFVTDDGVLYNKNCYRCDLTTPNTNGDIIKVERDGNVIWERVNAKIKEMTIKEISELLGYEVKIVKEK